MRNQGNKISNSRAGLVLEGELCSDCRSGGDQAGPCTFNIISLKAHWNQSGGEVLRFAGFNSADRSEIMSAVTVPMG